MKKSKKKKLHKIRICTKCGRSTTKAQGARKYLTCSTKSFEPPQKVWLCMRCQ